MALSDNSAAYLAKWTELDQLLADNPVPVGSIIVFAERYTTHWEVDMATTTNYVDNANGSTAGITNGKNLAKDDIGTLGGDMAGMGFAYAVTKGDLPELELKMSKLTFGKIRHQTNDPDVAGIIKDIKDTLSPFITSDPIISVDYFTTVSIAAMMTGSTTYVGKLGKYKNKLDAIDAAKSSFVTLMIPIMEKNISFFETFLNTIDDFYPDFVTSFRRIVKKLDELGKRNQGVEPTFKNAETLEILGLGGLMTILNYAPTKKAKIAKTNAMSTCMMSMRVGMWITKYSFPGFYPLTVKHTVKARRTIVMDILLVPIPPPPPI